MKFLDLEMVLGIHFRFVGDNDVRDYGLLHSALARPVATVFGADAYPSVWEKAAALLDSLARNHAFADGNKRTAWAATRLFLDLNGHPKLTGRNIDASEELVMAVAQGKLEVPRIAERLKELIV